MQELLDKCHPLGMFDSIATLAVASNMRELYRLVLVDTPLAPYFSENLTVGPTTSWGGIYEAWCMCRASVTFCRLHKNHCHRIHQSHAPLERHHTKTHFGVQWEASFCASCIFLQPQIITLSSTGHT